MSEPSAPSLADIRAEIDRIDAAMHTLLMQRGEIIDRLTLIKKSQETGSAFRPAREAAMMVALAERHHGKLPVELVAHIWRQIISTFTYIQAPYSVHLVAGDERARELARFHFGFSVPFIPHAGAQALISGVAHERGDLGFLHLATTPGAWWRTIGRDGAPMVMASAPAITRAPRPPLPEALVIGNTGFDVAGLDRRLVGVTLSGHSGFSEGAEVLARADEDGRRHALIWGPADKTPERIAEALGPQLEIEELWTVGYTAKPVAA